VKNSLDFPCAENSNYKNVIKLRLAYGKSNISDYLHVNYPP